MKNKFNWQPVKEVLGWLGVVAGTFIYAMLIQLIVSFVGSGYLHMKIEKMFIAAIVITAVAAVLYPVLRALKLSREKKKEEELKEWHKQK